MIHVLLDDVPGAIREATRNVLNARGYRIVDRRGVEIGIDDAERLLHDLADSCAKAVAALEVKDP